MAHSALRLSWVRAAGVAAALQLLTCFGVLAQSPGIKIMAPANGMVVSPGQSVVVTISPVGPTVISAASATFLPFAQAPQVIQSAPYQITLQVPTGQFGSIPISAIAADNQGNILTDMISVTVTTGSTATGISVNPNALPFTSASNPPRALSVTATFQDGTSGYVTSSPGTSYTSSNTTVATVSASGRVQPVGPGQANILVSYGGISATVPVTVGTLPANATTSAVSGGATSPPSNSNALQPQTIAFGAIGAQNILEGPLTLSATASSGLTVTFTSNTAPVCTVSVATVTFVAAGTCSITASQPGNANYSAATPVTQTFAINPVHGSAASGVSLASSANPAVFGHALTLTATVTPSTATGSVTFFDGVTILGSKPLGGGTAAFVTSLLAPGKRSLKAVYVGDATYAPSTSPALAEVVNAIAGIGFQTPVSYPVSVGENAAVAVGDFNGDGRPDLAVGESVGFGLGVGILLGNGDGTFKSAVGYALSRDDRISSLATADFNGDGKQDLIAGGGNEAVSVLLGNGDGTFQAATFFGGGDTFSSFAVGDFNGDGKADFVVNSIIGGLVICLGNGDGTFQAGVKLSGFSGNLNAMVVGDFNGDGKADIAGSSGNSVIVLLGNGDGTFQSAAGSQSSGYATSLITADFNGDGNADLAFTTGTAPGMVTVLLGNGDGIFQSGVQYPAGAMGGSLALGDFNADGNPDLVVLNGGNNMSVLLGNGDGTFQAPVTYLAGASSALAVADLNGDGRDDLVIVESPAGYVNVVLGSAPTSPVTIQTNPATVGLQFSVDGGAVQTAPQTLLLTQGPHKIAVATTQAGTAGTQFVWSGWSDGGAASHSITVGATAATYTASFTAQYLLTISASPVAGGTVSPVSGGFYNAGSAVAISALANSGYVFANWTGSVAGPTSASTSVTMSAPETVTAKFMPLPANVSVSPSAGSGTTQVFTAVYSDTAGAGALNNRDLLIGATPSDLAACQVTYHSGGFYLVNDFGSAELGPLASGGMLSNSQCTLNGGLVSNSGNTSTVTFSVTFKSSYFGTKNLYLYCDDTAGNNTGYQPSGTFIVGGRINLTVFRPTYFANWYVNSAAGTQTAQQWGLAADVPLTGDFDGDGILDYAVFRPSTQEWFIIPSSAPTTVNYKQWGLLNDIPVPGDYDGDGKTDIAVWRPSTGTWYVVPSGNPGTYIQKQWGLPGDTPVQGDFDGDGKADLAVWRPSTGTWYIVPSSNPLTYIQQQWGLNGDEPVTGDYDGDRKTDLAVYRPSTATWYVVPSTAPSLYIQQQWGLPGDIPVPRDYDQDGKTDFAVWRPSTGTWYFRESSLPGNFQQVQWGLFGDVPLYKPAGN